MNILLIRPPARYVPGASRPAASIPVGILSIAAVLEEDGFRVEVLDAQTDVSEPVRREADGAIHAGLPWDQLEREITARKPDIVGISCPFTAQRNGAIRAAGIARRAAPVSPAMSPDGRWVAFTVTTVKEEDFIDRLFVANTHDTVLCFSSRGRVYWLKVYNVPQGSRSSRGKPIVNLVPLVEREKITAILPVREFAEGKYVLMATATGTVKKTPLADFSRPRPSGIIAVDLSEGDQLIGVALTDGQHDVMLFSSGGKAVRFDENDVRPMGLGAHGVRGMALDGEQRVISMLVAEQST